jgi:serine/threonine protein kinase
VDEVEFGRYRLIEMIGEGGMGEVWRAHDTVTDRVVAIKLLPPKLSKDEDFQQRFRREALAAARLETPHVVPIHDYGEIDGRLFVCMRLIKGRDLATLLADGRLEPARAARIIGQVAEALQAAHEIGLIHRDIKPSNILLDDRDFAYLIDFGIARAAEDTRMTKTGNTIGTFAYIAPERLDGRGDEDARVDIYSLACVLYECLAGAPPFGGDTMARLVAAHLNTPPPRPSIARSDVPAQVDEVIATGMAKNPDERYATTVELADAARDAITAPFDLPARAAFVTPAAQTIPAAEATDLNLDTTQQRPADRPPAEASTPSRKPWWPPRGRAGLIAAIIAAVVLLVAGFVIFRPQQPARPPAPAAVSTTQPAPPPPPPPKLVEEAALEGLLLSPDQINNAMGARGMTVYQPWHSLMDVGQIPATPAECLPIDGAAEEGAYAGSGWIAVRGQTLEDKDPSGKHSYLHAVDQGVVLFPTAQAAAAFASASSQSWSACANRSYKDSNNNTWSAGPVSTSNGTVSVTSRKTDGWACQRALMARNNVVIDATGCAFSTTNQGISIADQIAAKVPTT